MKIKSAFKPAWWLGNAHTQTLFASLFRSITLSNLRYERLTLPDDDFIDLVWLDEGLSADAPLVVLLHGLGGGMSSVYLQAQMLRYQQLGWRAVLMYFRGASEEPNRKLRFYHSGDTADLNYFLKHLVEQEPHTTKFAVGFSLGGNVLLKWLGENVAQPILAATVAVSVPFMVNKVADRVNRGFSRVYQAYLLFRLRQYFYRKLKDNPNEKLRQTVKSCQSFWTFDDLVTAPLNGFKDAHDYYQSASCKPFLCKIDTPTLIIHAEDDPFMSPEVIPTNDELSPHITLELSEKGGHVGFVSGTIPWRPKYWLDDRIPAFLNSQLPPS